MLRLLGLCVQEINADDVGGGVEDDGAVGSVDLAWCGGGINLGGVDGDGEGWVVQVDDAGAVGRGG